MTKTIKVVTILTVLFITTNLAKAQFGGNGGGINIPGSQSGGATPGSSGTPGVPFDGGLSLILLAAGAGISAKNRKKVLEVN